MFLYILKRILLFIPTFLVISLVAFTLSKCSPGDPVERLLNSSSPDGGAHGMLTYKRDYQIKVRQLGLDKPTFYFELTAAAYPDTLYRIQPFNKRTLMEKFIAQYGNWASIDRFTKKREAVEQQLFELPDSLGANALIGLKKTFRNLAFVHQDKKIQYMFAKVEKVLSENPVIDQAIGTDLEQLFASYNNIRAQATPNLCAIPRFIWYGFDNQYHNWLTAFVSGDFGISLQNGQPSGGRIRDAIWWTAVMSVLSIICAFGLAIPIGVYTAQRQGSYFDRVTSTLLFMLYSLPTFWVATMLVVFFTTPEYGKWANIFPSIGLGNLTQGDPFWPRFWQRLSHLILPVFCLTYASLAFIARQMRESILSVNRLDYIRTARAKGLSSQVILWKHAFRNAIFPLITMIALLFPAVIAGSVAIELIFNIPGMGLLVYDSIVAEDWPVVFTVLLLTAVMTMLGNLVADILYTFANPRVKFRS